VASLWELAIKSSKGKLPTFEAMIASRPLELILSDSGIALLDIGLDHVMTTYRLPYHHRDPFDRMMIAQALNESMTLITSDETFARYPGLSLLEA
jgi:PIN domain nuclease of toxin-antitoxin system